MLPRWATICHKSRCFRWRWRKHDRRVIRWSRRGTHRKWWTSWSPRAWTRWRTWLFRWPKPQFLFRSLLDCDRWLMLQWSHCATVACSGSPIWPCRISSFCCHCSPVPLCTWPSNWERTERSWLPRTCRQCDTFCGQCRLSSSPSRWTFRDLFSATGRAVISSHWCR